MTTVRTVTPIRTAEEQALVDANDYLAHALRTRSNDISRAKRYVREAQAALCRTGSAVTITVHDEGDPFEVVRRDGEMIGELFLGHEERWVDTLMWWDPLWYASAIIVTDEGREMVPASAPFGHKFDALLWIERTAA